MCNPGKVFPHTTRFLVNTGTGSSSAQRKDADLLPLSNAGQRLCPFFALLLQLSTVGIECALPLDGQSLAFLWLEGSFSHAQCVFVSSVSACGGEQVCWSLV